LLALADSQGKVFFAQDGATANEAALKLARRHGLSVAPDGSKQVFVAAHNGFHGRTMGSLAVTGNPAKRDPFGPFGYEVRFVDFGDVDALTSAMDSSVCALILEPIQGEGGLNVPPPGYLEAARNLATTFNAVFIADEVQSGIGRTGSWFASHAQGVRPDIITLAKGLGGGLPIGAMIVEPAFVDVLKPGDHGTTFGGSPISTRAALAVIDVIENDGLLAHVEMASDWLFQNILGLDHPAIQTVRGRGLWLAIVLTADNAAAVELAALEAGFLVNAVKPNAIRLAPPLNISVEELATFVAALPAILDRAA
jgi:acetylornithine aminotransferase